MNQQADFLHVECAWCKVTMREGQKLEGRVSHAICCECKAKYFPTLADASGHQWEVTGQDHVSCAAGNEPREVVCHIDKRHCSRCEMTETMEPYPCDCHD